MAWPDYQQLSLRSVTLRQLFANIRLLKTMRIAALILLLIMVYVVGTHLSLLLFLNNKRLHNSIAQSTFLTIIDQLFTGGSLSVLSPFALGIFPLVLFRSWRLNILASVVFVVGLIFIILWLSLSDIVPTTFIDVAVTFLYLTAGSGLLFFINYQLTRHKGPTIIAINAIVIAYTYARMLLFSKQSGELGVLALILLFAGSFVLLIRYVKYVPLVNIRDETVRRGHLPIPATNSSMRFALLITTFIILAAITTLLNFFLGHTLSPFGDSLLDVLFFIAILTAISTALISSELIDNVLSQFNGTATAHTLMINYWLVSDPPTPVGEATAQLLSREVLKCHRLNYVFYLVWAVLFSLVGLFAQVLHLPLNPLPFGPLGFLVILTLCCEFSYALVVATYRFVQSVRFGELWVPSTSALSNLQILKESYDLYEVIEQILPLATAEERERLSFILLSLREGKVRFAYIKELLQILSQISKRWADNTPDTMFAHLIIRFFVCVILSLIVTIFAVWLVQLFLERTAFTDLGIKITEVLGLPGIFLAFVPIIGLDESIKEIFSALKTNPKRIFQRMSTKNLHSALATYEPERAALAYQVLLRQQRDLIDENRRTILVGEDVHMCVLDMICMIVDRNVDTVLSDTLVTKDQIDHLIDELDTWHLLPEILPVELEELRDRDAIRKVFHWLSTSFYEEQGKQFDEQLISLKEVDIQNLRLKDKSILAPLRVMERDLWLNFLDSFWSSHADELNAARVRILSILGIQKEDLEQFEQQADDDFERLQLDIQLNTIYTLLGILQVSLSYFFPQSRKRNESETIIDASISQNTVKMIQTSPTTDTTETPKTPPADVTAKVMEMVGMEEDMPLESSMVSRFIEQAQTKVEGYNFDIRKNVVDYDDVIAKQRQVIYADRRAVLERADMHERVLGMMRAEVNKLVDACIPGTVITEEEQLEKLLTMMEAWVHVPEDVLPENIHAIRREDLRSKLVELTIEHYEESGAKLDELAEQNPGIGIPTIRDFERSITLQVVDRLWMDHIDALDVMRASIHFRSIGQRDPLVEFKNEAFRMFDELKAAIQYHIVSELLKLMRGEFSIRVQQPAPQRKAPRKLRTNADDLARAIGQAKSDTVEDSPAAKSSRRNGASSGQRGQNGRTSGGTQAARASTPGRIGRNDPCPCGSGKKYKKCHGA